jgi:hypothetical protein
MGVGRSVDGRVHGAARVADLFGQCADGQIPAETLGRHPNAKFFAKVCHAGYYSVGKC